MAPLLPSRRGNKAQLAQAVQPHYISMAAGGAGASCPIGPEAHPIEAFLSRPAGDSTCPSVILSPAWPLPGRTGVFDAPLRKLWGFGRSCEDEADSPRDACAIDACAIDAFAIAVRPQHLRTATTAGNESPSSGCKPSPLELCSRSHVPPLSASSPAASRCGLCSPAAVFSLPDGAEIPPSQMFTRRSLPASSSGHGSDRSFFG